MWTITLADLISWTITICIAGLVFVYYRKRRIDIASQQKEIARRTALRGFEEDIMALFRRRLVKAFDEDSPKTPEQRSFRYVLDNDPPWKFIEDPSCRESGGWTWAKCLTFDGERHWQIREFQREDGKTERQYIASEAFQEVLLWFRRMFNAYETKVVQDADLANLWRFILPFGFAGRLQYFRRYFQGEEDIQAMVKIVNIVLEHCLRQQYRKPVHYFMEYVTDEEEEILTRTNETKELYKSLATLGK